MQARLINENEREYFNNFLQSVPKGHILQSYEWGEIKSKTNWQPLRMIIEENNEPMGAISILKESYCIKSASLCSTGPVFDLERPEIFDYILDEVKKLAVKHQAIFLKIDPDIPKANENFGNLLKTRGFISAEKGEGFDGIQPKFVFLLDITPDEETLLKNMHSKTRYNIRLAERKGVTIKEDCTKADLKEFYRILLETCERDNFLVRPYSYFEELWDYLVEKGYAKLFMAEYEGKYIAGTLVFLFGQKAIYIYGASSNSHRNVMPNYLIQWTMIKWAKANGAKVYDFIEGPWRPDRGQPLIWFVPFQGF